MLRKQLAYLKDLRWYEWVIVLGHLIPGAVLFKCYLETLIYVAKIALGL